VIDSVADLPGVIADINARLTRGEKPWAEFRAGLFECRKRGVI